MFWFSGVKRGPVHPPILGEVADRSKGHAAIWRGQAGEIGQHKPHEVQQEEV